MAKRATRLEVGNVRDVATIRFANGTRVLTTADMQHVLDKGAHPGDAPDSLQFPPHVLDYLHNDRRLSDGTIDLFNLAWDAEKSAIVIPVEDRIKYHRGPRPGRPRCSHPPG